MSTRYPDIVQLAGRTEVWPALVRSESVGGRHEAVPGALSQPVDAVAAPTDAAVERLSPGLSAPPPRTAGAPGPRPASAASVSVSNTFVTSKHDAPRHRAGLGPN